MSSDRVTARDYALHLIERALDRSPNLDPDALFVQSGGAGPATERWPRYMYNGAGFWFTDNTGKNRSVKRGQVAVEVGSGDHRDAGLFKIADLIAEARSGAKQETLF